MKFRPSRHGGRSKVASPPRLFLRRRAAPEITWGSVEEHELFNIRVSNIEVQFEKAEYLEVFHPDLVISLRQIKFHYGQFT
jgi:hypothetical protein